jgi:hypothetical protein
MQHVKIPGKQGRIYRVSDRDHDDFTSSALVKFTHWQIRAQQIDCAAKGQQRGLMKVKIMGWDKYNARRNHLAHAQWFKFWHSAFDSVSLFNLTPAERWVFVCLLGAASMKSASDGAIEYTNAWLAQRFNIPVETVISAINKLIDNKVLDADEAPIQQQGSNAHHAKVHDNSVGILSTGINQLNNQSEFNSSSDSLTTSATLVQHQCNTSVAAEKRREEKKKRIQVLCADAHATQIIPEYSSLFDHLWQEYPRQGRVRKKAAARSFHASVRSAEAASQIKQALENYKASERVKDGFIQNASTWFANWSDWIDMKPQRTKTMAEILAERNLNAS